MADPTPNQIQTARARTPTELIRRATAGPRMESIETFWSAHRLMTEGGVPGIHGILSEIRSPQDSAQRLASIIAYSHHGAGEKGPGSRLQLEELGGFQPASTLDVRAIISKTWVEMARLGAPVSADAKRTILRNRWLGDVGPRPTPGVKYAHLQGTPLQGMGHLLEGDITRYHLERGIYGKPRGMFHQPMRGGSDTLYEDIFKKWSVSRDSWNRAAQIKGPQMDRFVANLEKKGLTQAETQALVAGKLRGRRIPDIRDYLTMSKRDRVEVARELPIFKMQPHEDMATRKAFSIASSRPSIAGAPTTQLVENPGQLENIMRGAQPPQQIIQGEPSEPPAYHKSHVDMFIQDGGFNKDLVRRHAAKLVRQGARNGR